MKRIMKKDLSILIGILTPAILTAAPVDLTFANHVGSSQPDDVGGMQYTDVANNASSGFNVNAVITNTTAYIGNDSENGNTGDDGRLNMRRDSSTRFSLSFYDADAGDGFTTLYNPVGLEFSLIIYDMDGREDPSVEGTDQITMHTLGTATFATTNDLIYDPNSDGSQTWVGDGDYPSVGSGNVPNPTGGATSLTEAQQRVAIKFDFTGQNVVDFTYTINDGQTDVLPITDPNNYRNLFIDGDDFDFTVETSTIVVPESSSLVLASLFLLSAIPLYRKFR